MADINVNNQWGCLRAIFLFLLGTGIILFGGLRLSKWIDTDIKSKVDKNGTFLKAVIMRKNSNSKGRSTFYKFNYKNKEFISNEGGRELYNMVSIGDTITIKIDTLDPRNTYVVFQ